VFDRRGTFAAPTEPAATTIAEVAPFHVASVREHFIDQLSPAGLTELSRACGPILDQLRLVRDRD
jgi:hypothetical protein